MGLFDRFKRAKAGTASDPTADGSSASEAVEKVVTVTAKGVFAAAANGESKTRAEDGSTAKPAEDPKPEDPKPEEGKPAEDPKPEDPKPEEDKPPEEEAPAAAAVVIPEAGSHQLFKLLAEDHGSEFASMAIDKGWGYVQALECRIAGLKHDKKTLEDRFATFAKANGGLGVPEAASFQENSATSAKQDAIASYEDDGASKGVAGFAATISFAGKN